MTAIVCSMVWPASVLAQRGQDAGLVGTVRDSSGALVSGAALTVSSPHLIGGPQKTVTDAAGVYRMSFLQPGRYDVGVEHAGFRRAGQSIDLPPGATLTLDFILTIASVTEQVLVQSPPPIVDVRTSAVTTQIDRPLLENLPLSRTASDAVNLAPGVIRDVAFGGTLLSNPFLLDGASGDEPGWGTATVHPNLNWIDELQIVSVGADARYGEFTGAQTHAIARSGSNQFAGLIDYWTTRPSWTGNNRGSLPAALRERFRPIEIIDRRDFDAQLGGPLVKDRLWFFAGGEGFRDVTRPVSFAGVPRTPNEPRIDNHEEKVIGKLTSAPSPALRVEGFYAYMGFDTTGTNAGPLVQPEALNIRRRTESMWDARLLWTLNPRTYLELRHGGHNVSYYGGPPDDRRSGPPGHVDQVTSVQSVNSYSWSSGLSKPVTTAAHLTYIASGPNGRTHDVRMGFEWERARLLQVDGYVGNMVFLDSSGKSDLVVLWDGQTYRPRHDRATFYAQDAWSLASAVTLNVGVRAGLYRGSVPERADAFSAHSLSPRLGVAWDIFKDHRTVVRLHYGRYHEQMVTSFYDFLDPLGQTPEITATVVGPNQFNELFRSGAAASRSMDADLRYPFDEEILAGVERQLPFGISGKLHFIHRDFKDTIGYIDTGSTWQPFQALDPGPDGVAGTADDGGLFTMFENLDPSAAKLLLTNPPAYRRYNGIQAVARRRYARALDFQASYTWSRTVGNYNNFSYTNAATNDLGSGGTFVNPNAAINVGGRTPQDYAHEFKLVGLHRVEVWGGLNVSGVYRFQSGRPWARSVGGYRARTRVNTVLVERRGTRHLDAVNQLDLRLEKTWRPGSRLGRLGVFADVFNVGNQGVALSLTNQSGPNLGVPQTWTEPRMLRLGVRTIF